MIYLIDGHNLIPKLKGISLDDPDDEEQLIQRLDQFIKLKKGRLEIYFDGAPYGFGHTIHRGRMTIQFVAKPSSADDAIINKICKVKSTASNYTVVSSDRRILSEAKARGFRTQTSELFAEQMESTKSKPTSADALLEEDDNDREAWMQLFNRGKL